MEKDDNKKNATEKDNDKKIILTEKNILDVYKHLLGSNDDLPDDEIKKVLDRFEELSNYKA